MTAKTVTLDEDAYEKLVASMQPGESFSDVVRRGSFEKPGPGTGAALLEYMRKGGSGLSEESLGLIEEAVEHGRSYNNRANASKILSS